MIEKTNVGEAERTERDKMRGHRWFLMRMEEREGKGRREEEKKS